MHLSARPAAVIAGLTLAVSACFTPATAAAKAPTLFTDEFTGPTLDSSAWALLNRPGGEDGLEYYAPANATITNGALNVLTKVDGAFSCCRHSSAELQWRSAGFTYGTVEVRARLAGGQGTWPAIWLLGQGCQVSNLTTPANVGSCNWPFPGSDEIDIAEVLGSDPRFVNQQMHSSDHADGCRPQTIDVSAGFHTYRLVWQPGSLIWSIDGVTTCQVSASYVPNTPMFLIINTAVGGQAGAVVDSTLPQTTLVDYVRVTGVEGAPVSGLPGLSLQIFLALLLLGTGLAALRALPLPRSI